MLHATDADSRGTLRTMYGTDADISGARCYLRVAARPGRSVEDVFELRSVEHPEGPGVDLARMRFAEL